MTPAEDAKATWNVLNELERAVLAVLDTPQVVTPQDIANRLVISRQRASLVARQLKTLGLVRVNSLPKQTSYELSGQGEACLDAGREAGGVPGEWRASERATLANTGWRATVFWFEPNRGWSSPKTFDGYENADAAIAAAKAEADRRNAARLDSSQVMP